MEASPPKQKKVRTTRARVAASSDRLLFVCAGPNIKKYNFFASANIITIIYISKLTQSSPSGQISWTRMIPVHYFH